MLALLQSRQTVALDLLPGLFVRVPQHGSRRTSVLQCLYLDAHQPQTMLVALRRGRRRGTQRGTMSEEVYQIPASQGLPLRSTTRPPNLETLRNPDYG